MIEVCAMKLSGIRNREEYLYGEADRQRRTKALRFIRADDRLRCLAAGYLMKRCLPGYREELLYTGTNGKPFLRGGPAFSISHGGDYIVLAWSGEADSIGIDAEPIREMEYYRSILPFYATAEEQETIGDDARKAVRVWTRKESLYKCAGGGVSDFRELPGILEDRVLFLGKPYHLASREEDGHMFSAALGGPMDGGDGSFCPIRMIRISD